ncbi:MAG: glycosyltransferase family 4 protein [Xanthobacteraceae bacterium]
MTTRKRPLRVLHTEASTGWGGQEIRILNESSGLRERGYEVQIAAPAEAQIVPAAKDYGVPLHAIPINRRSLGAFRAVVRLLASFKPDVVITHSSTDSWLVALAARVSSARPVVIRMRHLSTPVAGGPLNRWLYGRAAKFLVATGKATRNALVEKFRLDPEKVFSIPTGTDLSRFQPGDRAQARIAVGLGSTGPVVAIVATLRHWKGHRFLISALGDPRLASAELVVVGDGPQEQALREQAVTDNVANRVHFAGRQKDVVPWLQACDVFALPSTGHETTPQAIQQALACGIPVVTTPSGAGLELVRDGETGLIVPANDVTALADAIVRLLSNPDLARRLSDAGRKDVAAKFTAAAMLDAMEEVLQKAVSEAR